jgi:2-polyprenyl-6-hydroxyphenyl methylase/3-demethylubiquinone-9 3-methyltransferase
MSEPQIADFYETYWRGAAGDPEQAQLVSERKARLEAVLVMLPRGAHILDVGCGDGVFANFFAGRGFRASGVDISQVGIQRAQTLYPQLSFQVASPEARLPFEDGEFDAVWCSEVVEHLFDVGHALAEMARVLKEGGTLILTTPYHGLLKNLIVVLRTFDSHFDVGGGHIRFFTRGALGRLLNETGFDVTEMNGVGRRWPLWMSHWIVARKRA